MTDKSQTSRLELTKIASSLPPTVPMTVPTTQKEMVEQAVSVALRPAFLETLDEEIGDPLEGESRDAFIKRGQQKIVDKLTNLLG